MADSAKLDLAERLKSLHSQLVPKGKQLSLIELVEALIPNVNEGLVVVSSCHGLGALLYILMVVVGIPVNMLIVIEKDQRVREWSDGFTRPLLQHIGSKSAASGRRPMSRPTSRHHPNSRRQTKSTRRQPTIAGNHQIYEDANVVTRQQRRLDSSHEDLNILW